VQAHGADAEEASRLNQFAAIRSTTIRAIVSDEPGVIFAGDATPAPAPLHRGEQAAGAPVDADGFACLARHPIQIVYGDNIPRASVPNLIADSPRAQVVSSTLLDEALNARGCRASVLQLPAVGLRGNSHFMFSDLTTSRSRTSSQNFRSPTALAGDGKVGAHEGR
jgi:hypothetical protein